MKVYLDFDDYIPNETDTSLLRDLKDYFPNFKVNLFTVWKNKSEKDWLLRQDWVSTCFHGLKHSLWEEFELSDLEGWYGEKIYRAPFWKLPESLYIKLITDGWKVMLNPEEYLEMRNGIYFNWNIKDPPDLTKSVLIGHGHMTPYNNGIEESIDRIKLLPQSTEFGFLKELENEQRRE